MEEKKYNRCYKENCFECPCAKATFIDDDIILVCRRRKFIRIFTDDCKDIEEDLNGVFSSI